MKAKAYVVVNRDGDIQGVYTTEKRARMVESITGYTDWRIIKIPMNRLPKSATPKGLHAWHAYISRSGTWEAIRWNDSLDSESEHMFYDDGGFETHVVAKTKQKAIEAGIARHKIRLEQCEKYGWHLYPENRCLIWCSHDEVTPNLFGKPDPLLCEAE